MSDDTIDIKGHGDPANGAMVINLRKGESVKVGEVEVVILRTKNNVVSLVVIAPKTLVIERRTGKQTSR